MSKSNRIILKSSMHCSRFIFLLWFVATVSQAVIVPQTRESLQELAEQIEMQLDEERISIRDLQPLMIAEIRTERSSSAEIRNALIAQLQQYALEGTIAVCDICGQSKTKMKNGTTYFENRQTSMQDVRDYLAAIPNGNQFKSALWLEETQQGITFRISKISSGEVLAANTIINGQALTVRSQSHFTVAKNRQRIARGQSLLHSYFDMSFLMGNHFSYNAYEQWGYYGEHLTGVGFSLSTPVLGVSANYARVYQELNKSLVGMKLLLSLPNAVTSSLDEDSNNEGDTFGDPLLTLMAFVRTPIGQSGDYGMFAFVTHTARFGIGVSF